MKAVRTSACSPSMDGRETHAFYLIVCVLLAVSASSGNSTTQELRGRKQRIQRQIRTNILQNSTKNRPKIDEKPSQIDEKSLLGGFGRSKPFQGRAGTRSGRPRAAPSRPGVDLGTPRARQERPGVDRKRPQDGPKTLPSPSGVTSVHIRRNALA